MVEPSGDLVTDHLGGIGTVDYGLVLDNLKSRFNCYGICGIKRQGKVGDLLNGLNHPGHNLGSGLFLRADVKIDYVGTLICLTLGQILDKGLVASFDRFPDVGGNNVNALAKN